MYGKMGKSWRENAGISLNHTQQSALYNHKTVHLSSFQAHLRFVACRWHNFFDVANFSYNSSLVILFYTAKRRTRFYNKGAFHPMHRRLQSAPSIAQVEAPKPEPTK
jgi:hypothetical protein